MKRLLFILTLLLLGTTLFGQHPKKAEKAYAAAMDAYMERDYSTAYNQLVKALAIDPNYAEAWLMEGEVGMEQGNADMAILGYEKALAIDSMLFPPAAITLSRLYNEQSQYDRMIPLLSWYRSKASGNAANDAAVEELLALAEFRSWAMRHPVDFNPENLGTVVNTKDEEYVNMLVFNGNQLIFTRKEILDEQRGLAREMLYVANYENGVWTNVEPLKINGLPEDIDLGAAFVSADGNKLYFTGCGSYRGSSCDLYVSDFRNGVWNTPRSLGECVNTGSWESQPCVSADGKELYFVSRRSGNADIYRCLRNADGSWGQAQNLGAPINTSGKEMAPFLHPDGRTLYFSSDKHVGMGGFDLFMSRRNEKDEWQEPVNLGFPINTSSDEINFFVASDGKTAFISSQREGGQGGYDIYSFLLPDDFAADSADYLQTVDVVEFAQGDTIVLQNIQFEFNSEQLTTDSEIGIQMLFGFLQRNPELKVELAGHTDNVGSEKYNQKLSADRAEVVRQALINKGVAPERLTSKGYGSTRPLAPNDTDEHRALNRRTEMVVVE